MINVQRYPAKMFTPETPCVHATDYDAAQSELAALWEDLSKVNREKNDVAYRANETAERLNSMTISKATMQNKLKQKLASTQQRLTAAEQRNAELERDAARYRWLRNPEQRDCVPPELDVICGIAEGEDVLWFEQLDRTIDAALKPTESGASE